MLDEKRVLVCEDDPEIAQEIKTAIEDAFPCATVDIACPWKEVVKTLDDLTHNRIDPYGFVFIDVHHYCDGTKDGPVAYVSDLPFIDRLMSDSSGRVVFFMSAHLTDPKIVELRRRCDKLSQARPMFIEKDLALNFIDEILTWMHSTVHSRRIQELLSETFGARRRLPVQNSNPAFTRAPAGRDGPVGADATQMLSGLSRDIAKHWVYLDNDTKRRVRDYFKVVAEGEKIRVSML